MGLSYAEAKALGIGHLHPAAPATRPEAPAPSPDGLNKTERAFYEHCRSVPFLVVYAHAFKVRLAGRTWYTPDFLVISYSNDWMIEIKGHMRDDAAVKLKVAADLYPQFRWLLVRRRPTAIGWDVREVNRSGIGTEPILVPWLTGR